MRRLIVTLYILLFCVCVSATARAQNLRAVPVTASDLAYSPLTNRIYASVAAGNSIVAIDPVAGAVDGAPLIVGSQPGKLAISDTGQYLYVGLAGAQFVKRVDLLSGTIDLSFPLPTDSFLGPMYVEDMAVMPGHPDTVAISLRNDGFSPKHMGVAIFDHGVMRPTMTPGHTGSNAIAFGSETVLYGYNNETTEYGFRVMTVSPSGVTIDSATPDLISGFGVDFKVGGGQVYATTGAIIDPVGLNLVGTFALVNQAFSNPVEPDPAAGAVFFVTKDWMTGKWFRRTFSIATQLQTDLKELTGVTGGNATTLVKWGANGLAFAMSTGSVWLMDDGLVTSAPPSLTITTPTLDDTWSMTAGTLAIGGVASDPGGAPLQITWSSDRGGSGAIPGSTTWQLADVPVRPGLNTITVTLVGSTGRTATDVLTIDASGERTYFLAEGATGSFFDLDLALANPNNAPAPITITYLKEGGSTVTQNMTLAPMSRSTILVDTIPGLESAALSTIVKSLDGVPLIVERTMRWDQKGQYGSHGDKATAGVGTTWYFAEGSQGFFATYLLLANPNDVPNTATVDWLRETEPPLRRTYSLAPNSRTTIYAGDDPELVNRSFGIIVRFATPAVADRSMYFGFPPDVLFKGGHNSAGVNAPSTSWLLAEGATGPFFETFILIANPNPVDVPVTLTFLPSTGVPVIRSLTVPANGRRTIDLESLDPPAPELANAAVATQVVSTLPVVVERAQYWPGPPDNWYEAHNSFGVANPGRRWGLAEGRVGNPVEFPPAAYQSFILLANPGSTAANVTLTFLRKNGAPFQKSFVVQPQSRRNVQVAGPASEVPELADETFGVIIDSDQPIAVERAMYGSPNGQVFGSGTNATATPLP